MLERASLRYSEQIDDDPYDLYLQSVRAHRRLLTDMVEILSRSGEMDRSQNPKHVTISLNGEPTLYSRLGEFLDMSVWDQYFSCDKWQSSEGD